MSHVRVEIDSDRIATLWLDAPGKRVNTLSRAMWADLAGAIEQIENEKVAGAIIASAKPASFCVGADLFEMREMSDEELSRYLFDGQEILNRFERLKYSTVAAINGDCLGGGLELALACTERIVIDEPKIRIGLPETTLGLVPGWGGTVRLSALIGLNEALPRLAFGELFQLQMAAQLGLTDEIASKEKIVHRAHIFARGQSPQKRIEITALNQHQSLLSDTESMIRRRCDADHLPAALAILRIAHATQMNGNSAGFKAEREALVELRRSPEGTKLLQAFFNRPAAKRRDQPM